MLRWLKSVKCGSLTMATIPMALFRYRWHCLDAFSPRWLLLVPMLVMAHYGNWWLHGSSWLVMVSDSYWHLLTAFNGLHFPPPTPDGCAWVHMVYEGSMVPAGSGWLHMDCDGFQWWFTAPDESMAQFRFWWLLMPSYGFKLLPVAPGGFWWLINDSWLLLGSMASNGFVWLPLATYCSIAPDGLWWLLMASNGFWWLSMPP